MEQIFIILGITLLLMRLTLGPFKKKKTNQSIAPVEIIRRNGDQLMTESKYEDYYNRIATAADKFNAEHERQIIIKCISAFQNQYHYKSDCLLDVSRLISILEHREYVIGKGIDILGLGYPMNPN